MQGRQG